MASNIPKTFTRKSSKSEEKEDLLIFRDTSEGHRLFTVNHEKISKARNFGRSADGRYAAFSLSLINRSEKKSHFTVIIDRKKLTTKTIQSEQPFTHGRINNLGELVAVCPSTTAFRNALLYSSANDTTSIFKCQVTILDDTDKFTCLLHKPKSAPKAYGIYDVFHNRQEDQIGHVQWLLKSWYLPVEERKADKFKQNDYAYARSCFQVTEVYFSESEPMTVESLDELCRAALQTSEQLKAFKLFIELRARSLSNFDDISRYMFVENTQLLIDGVVSSVDDMLALLEPSCVSRKSSLRI